MHEKSDMKLIMLSFGNSENPCLQHVHLYRGNLIKGLCWAISGQQFDIRIAKCMIAKYKVDNYYTLYTVSRGLMEIILKSSILEASTRARTGDSAETIKLFENAFFLQMNKTHNTSGMVNHKQKQFALSRVSILKLQKGMHEV